MYGLVRPLTIFTTKKSFNDRNADDMQYGDMDEKTLKNRFHLHQVSTFVDWCTYRSPYDHPSIRNLPAYPKEKVITMLFDELRNQSRAFSFIGTYQGLIVKLINHLQYKNGADYADLQMNQAYRNVILNDKSEGNVVTLIKDVLDTFVFKTKELTKDLFFQLLTRSHLPKFVGWKSCINGFGLDKEDISKISFNAIAFFQNLVRITALW